MSPVVLFARTWSANESGLLWERLWVRDGEGYAAKLVCSGGFTSPQRFTDEDAFWAAYEQEAGRTGIRSGLL